MVGIDQPQTRKLANAELEAQKPQTVVIIRGKLTIWAVSVSERAALH